MKTLAIGGMNASEIILGCMRIGGMSIPDASALIDAARAEGINFFDHADIYGGGKCEEVFAKAYTGKREDILIQSKCGIRKGFFDFSKEHILSSVDGILKRLNTEYLDVLLLHRPDTLMEPEEVAAAFDELSAKGKVRAFGVSNQNPGQIELLKKCVKQPLLFNQLQLSITNTGMIDAGFNVNMTVNAGVNRDGGILEYSRLHDMTIQAWSPFQYGFFEGVFIDNPKFPELNAKMDEIAAKYGITKTGLAVAWILRHPARIQPIAGTTTIARLKEISAAAKISLSRQDWYEIYLAAGNVLP